VAAAVVAGGLVVAAVVAGGLQLLLVR